MNSSHALSKFLSYVLRHHPESIGITLDTEGWTDINTLLHQSAKHHRHITRVQIDEVVANNNKKRFTISPDGTKIRASQGHSTTQVNIQHLIATPPDVLYHGTASHFLDSILTQGLLAGSRHHVHLSVDSATAIKVGQRHGKPIVLTIDAAAMLANDYVFYLSDNQVWLTKHVPAKFLSQM